MPCFLSACVAIRKYSGFLFMVEVIFFSHSKLGHLTCYGQLNTNRCDMCLFQEKLKKSAHAYPSSLFLCPGNNGHSVSLDSRVKKTST